MNNKCIVIAVFLLSVCIDAAAGCANDRPLESTLAGKIGLNTQEFSRQAAQHMAGPVIVPINTTAPTARDITMLLKLVFDPNDNSANAAIRVLGKVYRTTDDPAVRKMIGARFNEIVSGRLSRPAAGKKMVRGFIEYFRAFTMKYKKNQYRQQEIMAILAQPQDVRKEKKAAVVVHADDDLEKIRTLWTAYRSNGFNKQVFDGLVSRLHDVSLKTYTSNDTIPLKELDSLLMEMIAVYPDHYVAECAANVLTKRLTVITDDESGLSIVTCLMGYYANKYGIPREAVTAMQRIAFSRNDTCRELEKLVMAHGADMHLRAFAFFSYVFRVCRYQTTLGGLYCSSAYDMFLKSPPTCMFMEGYFKDAIREKCTQILMFGREGRLERVNDMPIDQYCRESGVSKTVAASMKRQHVVLEDWMTPLEGTEMFFVAKNYGHMPDGKSSGRLCILVSDVYVEREGYRYNLKGCAFTVRRNGVIRLERNTLMLYDIEREVGHALSLSDVFRYFVAYKGAAVAEWYAGSIGADRSALGAA